MKTYKEQFDVLTEAYINLNVNPFNTCNCFVGNLLGGRRAWAMYRDFESVMTEYEPKRCINSCVSTSFHPCQDEGYTIEEIVKLEQTFLLTYIRRNNNRAMFVKDIIHFNNLIDYPPNNFGYEYGMYDKVMEIQEEALFEAFEETLEVLRDIHIQKGEQIEEEPIFTKRELCHLEKYQ